MLKIHNGGKRFDILGNSVFIKYSYNYYLLVKRNRMRNRKLTSALMVMLAVTGSAYAAPEATRDGVVFTPDAVSMAGDARVTITGNTSKFMGNVSPTTSSPDRLSMDGNSSIVVSNGGNFNVDNLFNTPKLTMTDNAAVVVDGVKSKVNISASTGKTDRDKTIRENASITATGGSVIELQDRILMEKRGSIVADGNSDVYIRNIKVSGDDAKVTVTNGSLRTMEDGSHNGVYDYGLAVLDNGKLTVTNSSDAKVGTTGNTPLTIQDSANLVVEDSTKRVGLSGTYADNAKVIVSNATGSHSTDVASNVSGDGSIMLSNMSGFRNLVQTTVSDKASVIATNSQDISIKGTVSDNASIVVDNSKGQDITLSSGNRYETIVVNASGDTSLSMKDSTNSRIRGNYTGGTVMVDNSTDSLVNSTMADSAAISLIDSNHTTINTVASGSSLLSVENGSYTEVEGTFADNGTLVMTDTSNDHIAGTYAGNANIQMSNTSDNDIDATFMGDTKVTIANADNNTMQGTYNGDSTIHMDTVSNNHLNVSTNGGDMTISNSTNNTFDGYYNDNSSLSMNNVNNSSINTHYSGNATLNIEDSNNVTVYGSALGNSAVDISAANNFRISYSAIDDAKIHVHNSVNNEGDGLYNNVNLSGDATLDIHNGNSTIVNSIIANSGTVEFANNESLYVVGKTVINDSDGAKILYDVNADTVSTIGETINTVIDNAAGSQVVYNGTFQTGGSRGLDVSIKNGTDSILHIDDVAISTEDSTGINAIAMDGASNIIANVDNVTIAGGDNKILWNADASGSYTIQDIQINGQHNVITNSDVQNASIIGDANTTSSSTLSNVNITGNTNILDNAVLDSSIIIGNDNIVENGTLNNSRITGNRNELVGDNSSVIVNGNDNTLTNAEYSYVVGDKNEINGKNILAIGSNIKKTVSNSAFIGNESAYNDNAQQSAGTSTTNTSSTIGNLVFENTAGVGTNVGVVSFGKEDQTRIIQGVSAGLVGRDSTDAINGSQLYATNVAIANVGSSIATIMGGNAHMDNAGNIAMSNIGGTGKDTVDDAIRSNKERIDALESMNNGEETKSVGALSAALAGLHPMQYDPKKPSQIMAAVGQYDSKKAVALGLAHYVNEDLMFTTGLALQGSSHNKNMVNLGVTYKFGKGTDDNRKEYAAGPISSIYVMQDKIDALEQKNKELEEKVSALLAKLS